MARKKVKEVVQRERTGRLPAVQATGEAVPSEAGMGALEDHLLELVAEGKLAEAAGGAIRPRRSGGCRSRSSGVTT